MKPARSKRSPAAAATQQTKARAPALGAAPRTSTPPPEPPHGRWTAGCLAALVLLAAAVGVPHELMLQDTLKSLVVAGMALAALALWLSPAALAGHQTGGAWQAGDASDVGRWWWHGVLLLPLLLMVYALGSMAWSHTYLAGVETIRWALFAVLLWLGLNVLTPQRTIWLAWGVHGGAVVASTWAAAQFWADFKGFPQGPNPASTFINRNFFAEYLVCTLPYSVWLLLRLVRQSRGTAVVALLAGSVAFNLVALLMTGTRSALLATALMVLVTGSMGLLRLLKQTNDDRPGHERGFFHSLPQQVRANAVTALVTLGVVLGGLGLVPTGNASLIADHQVEGRGLTPFQRSLVRAQSVADTREYTERSFSLRWAMWQDTGRLIAAHPLAGVGAGAWEVQAPLYQTAGSQLETDYYVHNEPLQLVAEYGLVGWLFGLGLLAYLARQAWRTARGLATHPIASPPDDLPARSAAMLSLLALLVVSNAGFPWHMATTGALFALGLAVLAASDVRRADANQTEPRLRRWLGPVALSPTPRAAQLALAACALAVALYGYIGYQAARAEHLLVSAVKTALTISASGAPNEARWAEPKAQMLAQVREGVAITPHYRKLTPMVADELGRWGDWNNATWIWESVTRSRPYIVAMLTNIARGYAVQGDFERAQAYLKRSQALQPDAPSVRSLEVIVLSRTNRVDEAATRAKDALSHGIADNDLMTAAINLGLARKDWALVEQGFVARLRILPEHKADSWFNLGRLYADAHTGLANPDKALQAFKQALEAVHPDRRQAMLEAMPKPYRNAIAP